MTEPVKLLPIFVNEADRWDQARLYQAFVHRLRHLKPAGTTAQAGVLGSGRHLHVHRKGPLRHVELVANQQPQL